MVRCPKKIRLASQTTWILDTKVDDGSNIVDIIVDLLFEVQLPIYVLRILAFLARGTIQSHPNM